MGSKRMSILNIEEAADLLKMCRRSLETLVREGNIPGTQLVGKWIFSEEQLIKYVEELAVKNTKLDIPYENKPSLNTRRRNKGYNFHD